MLQLRYLIVLVVFACVGVSVSATDTLLGFESCMEVMDGSLVLQKSFSLPVWYIELQQGDTATFEYPGGREYSSPVLVEKVIVPIECYCFGAKLRFGISMGQYNYGFSGGGGGRVVEVKIPYSTPYVFVILDNAGFQMSSVSPCIYTFGVEYISGCDEQVRVLGYHIIMDSIYPMEVY